MKKAAVTAGLKWALERNPEAKTIAVSPSPIATGAKSPANPATADN